MTAIPMWTGDHRFDANEKVAVALALGQAILVWLVPLPVGARWVKTAVGAVVAGLQVLSVVMLGGLDGNDVGMIVTAVAGALGIAVMPAISTTGVAARIGLTD